MLTLSSLHSDKRGNISLIEGNDLDCYQEVTVFHTKKGRARGGCVHNKSDEFTCVIRGLVEYRLGECHFILQDGDSMLIPAGTPHYFLSLTDSIVLEWGATKEEKQEKHKEFRAIVDEINDPTD